MVWILTVVVYALVAAAAAFAYVSGTPFTLVTFGAACLSAGLRTAFMMHVYRELGKLPSRHPFLSPNVLVAGVWIFVETALACVLAIYGLHQVCLHESEGATAIGIAFAAFPAGIIQPWSAPRDAEG